MKSTASQTHVRGLCRSCYDTNIPILKHQSENHSNSAMKTWCTFKKILSICTLHTYYCSPNISMKFFQKLKPFMLLKKVKLDKNTYMYYIELQLWQHINLMQRSSAKSATLKWKKTLHLLYSTSRKGFHHHHSITNTPVLSV